MCLRVYRLLHDMLLVTGRLRVTKLLLEKHVTDDAGAQLALVERFEADQASKCAPSVVQVLVIVFVMISRFI